MPINQLLRIINLPNYPFLPERGAPQPPSSGGSSISGMCMKHVDGTRGLGDPTTLAHVANRTRRTLPFVPSPSSGDPSSFPRSRRATTSAHQPPNLTFFVLSLVPRTACGLIVRRVRPALGRIECGVRGVSCFVFSLGCAQHTTHLGPRMHARTRFRSVLGTTQTAESGQRTGMCAHAHPHVLSNAVGLCATDLVCPQRII
jgi:hypothetical protein